MLSIHKTLVTSTEGYSLETAGRDDVIYSAGVRRMRFYADPGQFGWIIFLNRFRWEPPHESDSVSNADRMAIKARVKEALEFAKCDCVYEE